MNILSKIRTYNKLGLSNLFRVAIYRFGIKTKSHKVIRISAGTPEAPFFHKEVKLAPNNAIANSNWQNNRAKYFGKTVKTYENIPDWFANPFRTNAHANSSSSWWQISDFDSNLGDIKTVWEASRFDWLISKSQRAALGNVSELDQLNIWLNDWAQNNPPYKGVNWKCGQEASIRVLHLLLATQVLGQVSNPTTGLKSLVKLHLQRIAPTISYAIGQSNNHGTSEAAALFVGGSWLVSLGDKSTEKWAEIGWFWLENRAQKLIEDDGTFSQYSITYHRMMLDTYCFCEIFRRNFNLPPFSEKTTARLSKATDWLLQMIDESTGDAPNIGANDGARIIPLSDSDYRDFRPSVQLAYALFQDKIAYSNKGIWDQPLIWLGIKKPTSIISSPRSISLDKGGFHILRKGKAVAYLRYPRFRFRPSQADSLHCDIWINGVNIARDAGTYSYNASHGITAYFNGTKAHNTIEFDGRDQMPRLGRFLFGDWLKAIDVSAVSEVDNVVGATAAYRDKQGAYHKRQLKLKNKQLLCIDEVSGFKEKAILRWQLIPSNWKLKDNILSNGKISITIKSSTPIKRINLTQGEESRYYLHKTSIPILEIEINKQATLTTEINF